MPRNLKPLGWNQVKELSFWKFGVLWIGGCLVVLGFHAQPGTAWALDTTEPFDAGLSDAEAYIGYDGLGRTQSPRELSNEFVLGYGLSDRLSIQGGVSFAAEESYFAGDKSLTVGLFATAVDRAHFDFDFMLDFGASGDGLGDLSIAPAIEANYDRDPGMNSWGLYLRTWMSAFRQWEDFGPDTRRRRGLLDYGVNPGAYLRLSPRHEILVEYDLSLALGDRREPDETAQVVGLGFNMQVSDGLELISQVQRDFPRGGRKQKFGVTVGFIATLPLGK